MKKSLKLTLGCVALATALGGCATTKPALEGHLDPNLGSAVKANIAAHFVEPSAKQKTDTFIPADPARSQMARQNYRENKIPDLKQDSNTSE